MNGVGVLKTCIIRPPLKGRCGPPFTARHTTTPETYRGKQTTTDIDIKSIRTLIPHSADEKDPTRDMDGVGGTKDTSDLTKLINPEGTLDYVLKAVRAALALKRHNCVTSINNFTRVSPPNIFYY